MADEQEKPPVEETVKEAPKEAADEIRQEAKVLEHTPPVEAFEASKEAIVDAIESIPAAPAHAEAPHVSNVTEIFGMTIPYPVYTVVFGVLGVLTILEVLVGTGGEGFLRIPLLVGLAGVKAVLVVMYYMHLKTDSRVYRWTLIIPLVIALAALLWLVIVPPEAY